MPAHKGVKLISRRSITGKYHSLRELVFALFDKKPTISKEEVEEVVRKEYPKSNFFARGGRGGHFSWYKHRWNKIKIEEDGFNLKDQHPKDAKGKANGRVSHESKKGKAKRAQTVGSKAAGKGSQKEVSSNRSNKRGSKTQVQDVPQS